MVIFLKIVKNGSFANFTDYSSKSNNLYFFTLALVQVTMLPWQHVHMTGGPKRHGLSELCTDKRL